MHFPGKDSVNFYAKIKNLVSLYPLYIFSLCFLV